MHYNYFRDYDPATGRYVQSDPIGLRGGTNTFAYARDNSFRWIDPYGLRPPTVGESGLIRQYFGNCIDPSTFDINVRQWGDTSRAFSGDGGFLSFPRSYFPNGDPDKELRLADPAVASVVAHEVLHQLQRANGIDVTSQGLALLFREKIFGADNYAYARSPDPAQILDTFVNGSIEQQGKIFQDYVYDALTSQDIARYSRVADRVKNQCSCRP